MFYKEHSYYVYIVASLSGTLYVGVTGRLERRIWEHKNHFYKKSFSARYSCHKLVYYEHFDWIQTAIAREKELKGWRRSKKEDLIRTLNPHWNDLYETLG